MTIGNKLSVLCFLIVATPVFASMSPPQPATNTASLSIQVNGSNKNAVNNCSPSLQNCTIQITQKDLGCLSQPGSITITNNSRINAMNIGASSTDSNFNTYVVQNNGCPTTLPPGRNCTISFFTNAPVAFTVPNVIVKGTNTSTTLFNIQAFQCAPTLGVTPATFTTTIGGSQLVTVTNFGNTTARNVTASPTSPLSVQSTTCGSSLPPGASCQITFNATGATTQSIPIQGANTNTISLPATVLGAVAGAPIHLTSVTGNGQATLTWGAPTNTGDSPITSYTITPFLGNTAQTPVTVASSVLTTTISGLTNGATYTFTVVANNASGKGLAAYSDFVTPNSGLVVNPSTLALSGLGGGAPRTFTVTNTSTQTITLSGVAPPIPPLPGSATVSIDNCSSVVNLLPGASCSMTIDPGAVATSSSSCTLGSSPTPSAIEFLPVSGPPATANIVILGYGCIYQSGYLFSIDDTTPTTASIGGIVAALNDQVPPATGITWSPGGVDTTIWGIGDASSPTSPSPNATSPSYPAVISLGQANCDGPDDGFCNTSNMVTFFSTGNTYSAGVCRGISDGGYLDWHLPAMCELGPFNPFGPSLCTPGSTNMLNELFLQGIGGIVDPGEYWSSTESSDVGIFAWNRLFQTGFPPSEQLLNGKNFAFGIRCARNLAN
ncbi:transmembrane protein (fibronectin III domain and Gp5 C-terminal repeat) [Legionella cherrii]|uniref:Transmembrane protein (Fibronectin III domain and Gp5 C-terminal repeat) n=2 Tax=Legionella cherrii TaxID=28084 RepID=A0ABY6T323_9GAMM|nr:transmembrane protein (fibronectin III domain and Gp5 C-terminal repeat) [Legionella cherrii]